jgi:shikimate dehydrogenase
MITGRTRVLAILGDPVRHSVSPAMHNAAIRALGLDAVYVALAVPVPAIGSVLGSLVRLQVAGNVTVPHKAAAYRAVDHLTELARVSGAVNTFWVAEGALHGDNTDVAGILEATRAMRAPGPWVLAGTGGSASAVALAAAAEGVALRVRSREPERAVAFAAWAHERGVDAAPDDQGSAGTLINATPLGLNGNDALPFPPERLTRAAAVLDLVYAPGGTPLVRAARTSGLRAADGRGVLVGQGAAAFERFFPGVVAPRDIMRAAVERALTP